MRCSSPAPIAALRTPGRSPRASANGSGAATVFAVLPQRQPYRSPTSPRSGTVPSGIGAPVGDASAACPAGSRSWSAADSRSPTGPVGDYAVPTSSLADQHAPALDGPGGEQQHRRAPLHRPRLLHGRDHRAEVRRCDAAHRRWRNSQPARSRHPLSCPEEAKEGQEEAEEEAGSAALGRGLRGPGHRARSRSSPTAGSTRATWLNSGRQRHGPGGTIHFTSQGICFYATSRRASPRLRGCS